MRSRLAVVLAVLAAIALVGALVHRSSNGADTKTTTKPKLDPNRIVTLPGPLQGGLLIADRGNDRILLVDPSRKTLWLFPTRQDRARGTHLIYDDDTFVEPGGTSLVTNEEDNGDILSIDIATHRVTRLFGVPGPQAGPGGNAGPPNRLNWPDDAYVLPDGTLTVAAPTAAASSSSATTASSGRSARRTSASTTRRARSGTSTETPRSPAAASSSPRSTARGSTSSVGQDG